MKETTKYSRDDLCKQLEVFIYGETSWGQEKAGVDELWWKERKKAKDASYRGRVCQNRGHQGCKPHQGKLQVGDCRRSLGVGRKGKTVVIKKLGEIDWIRNIRRKIWPRRGTKSSSGGGAILSGDKNREPSQGTKPKVIRAEAWGVAVH